MIKLGSRHVLFYFRFPNEGVYVSDRFAPGNSIFVERTYYSFYFRHVAAQFSIILLSGDKLDGTC